jgi:peptidoglycan/xylan/chitin deacetylase (PgdA/CDA1 family)
MYRLATAGRRRRLFKELNVAGRIPIAILFYHRVADTCLNPWSISRRNFVQHLDWLESNFDVITLAEAQARIRSQTNYRPSVVITFDDGYAENCDFALPELKRRNLPATYFVATDAVKNGTPFRHDLQCSRPLRPNTIAEIQDIARAGFEIGGHTKSHADIGRLTDPNAVCDEIVGGIEELEAWGVGPIRYFSFPTGLPENTSQLAVDLLLGSGLAGFCTAHGAWNWPASPGYHLRRIHADPGMQTLKNWLTLDPRKLRDHGAFPFQEPVAVPDSAGSVAGELATV